MGKPERHSGVEGRRGMDDFHRVRSLGTMPSQGPGLLCACKLNLHGLNDGWWLMSLPALEVSCTQGPGAERLVEV